MHPVPTRHMPSKLRKWYLQRLKFAGDARCCWDGNICAGEIGQGYCTCTNYRERITGECKSTSFWRQHAQVAKEETCSFKTRLTAATKVTQVVMMVMSKNRDWMTEWCSDVCMTEIGCIDGEEVGGWDDIDTGAETGVGGGVAGDEGTSRLSGGLKSQWERKMTMKGRHSHISKRWKCHTSQWILVENTMQIATGKRFLVHQHL